MANYCKCGCGTEIADNMTWVSGHNLKGRPVSVETRKKISEATKGRKSPMKGKTHTAETKKKISDALKGKTHTAEARKNMSDAHKGNPAPNKGKPHTAEAKQKMSDALKGRPSPNKGKAMSEEQKQKISIAKKGTPSHNKGKPCTDEIRKKISNTLKGRPIPDEVKKHMSAAKQGIPYDEWESFARESLYCPKFTEVCRESNRDKYDRKCFICGMTEEENGQKLSVHHVDMDKAQGCNSNWKLVPLCKHHHATSHNDETSSRLVYLLNDIDAQNS